MKPRGSNPITKPAVIQKATVDKKTKPNTVRSKSFVNKELSKEQDAAGDRRESPAGVHFATLYDACQRRFYFKYALRIEPMKTDKALIGGSAFHETKASFYMTGGMLKKSLNVGYRLIDEKRNDFYTEEDYQFTRNRLGPMMRNWVGTYGDKDFKRYDVVACEKELRLPIPFTPAYVTTQRHDALLKDKETGKIVTGETKTSSNSLDFTLNTVRMSDQVAAYIWGGYEVFGKRYAGLMIDVTYWSARSWNTDKIVSQRSEIITKTDYEIKLMQVNLAGLFNEIETKMTALKAGTPPEFLFRKNTFYCYAYFRRCPYADICGLNAEQAVKRLGDRLKVIDDDARLDSMTYDPYYFGEAML